MEKRSTDKKIFFLQILASITKKLNGIIEDLKQSQQDERQGDAVERALG